ncbi:MAG: hypothetical protein M1823_005092 [Watsoniomyces obsoletus]|nr:MAG: hypothetical protein M1823_005092 [Watsoniomyces obsoletus]
MAAMTAPPQQFKQPSRKGKRAWRKHVDLTTVEDGLETVRDEIIKGGVIAEKTSTELFSLDTSGDKIIQRQYQKQHKPLKADEILGQRSAVPAVDSHKRTSSRTTDGVLEPKQKRLRSGGVSQKELERLKKYARGGDIARAKTTEEHIPAEADLWANDETAKEEEAWRSSYPFLEPAKPIKEPSTLKREPISLAASGKEIPAVKKPKPEISYNPQSTEYFKAFIKKGDEEVQAELKRRREAEEEAERQIRIDKAREEAETHEQMIEGDESIWEGFESEADNQTVTVSELKKRPERKTKAQRNKIARRKEAEQKALMEAKMKKRAQEATQIDKIVRSLDRQRRESMKSSSTMTTKDPEGDLSSDEEEEVVLRRKRIGKAPLPQQNLEFILPSELKESLRQLKPQGNLLRDRFRSAILRGRLESRKPIQTPKSRKVTVTEKWTYKDWKLT